MILSINAHAHLYSFYERWQLGKLLLPPHQRGDVWSSAKKKKWLRDIEATSQLSNPVHRCIPGCIITYSIIGDSRVYINDGANRVIHSINEYIENCKVVGKDFKSILTSCIITNQHVEYGNAQEAISHFVNINLGTTATPHEVLKCTLIIELDNYVNTWEPLINKICNIVDSSVIRLGCKNSNNRERKHKLIRDSLCIFYRFISGDKSRWSPNVAIKTLNPDTIEKDSKLEARLSNTLKYLGYERVKEEVSNFEKFINNNYALYYQTWLECNRSLAEAPSATHFRWWLTLAVYRKNNDLSYEKFKELTKKLINHTEGRTSVFYLNEDGQKNNSNTALSKINNLPTILKAIDAEDFEYIEARKRETTLYKPGFQGSHVQSFYEHGNGKVLPENAIDNLRRGKKDMEAATVENLESIFSKV